MSVETIQNDLLKNHSFFSFKFVPIPIKFFVQFLY